MDYYLLNLLADFKMSFLQNENKTSEFLMWTWRATPKIYLTCINWLDTLNPKLSNIFELAFKIYEIFTISIFFVIIPMHIDISYCIPSCVLCMAKKFVGLEIFEQSLIFTT